MACWKDLDNDDSNLRGSFRENTVLYILEYLGTPWCALPKGKILSVNIFKLSSVQA